MRFHHSGFDVVVCCIDTIWKCVFQTSSNAVWTYAGGSWTAQTAQLLMLQLSKVWVCWGASDFRSHKKIRLLGSFQFKSLTGNSEIQMNRTTRDICSQPIFINLIFLCYCVAQTSLKIIPDRICQKMHLGWLNDASACISSFEWRLEKHFI